MEVSEMRRNHHHVPRVYSPLQRGLGNIFPGTESECELERLGKNMKSGR